MLLLSGLIFVLGASACISNEPSAPTSVGFVHPEVSLTPTKNLLNPTPTRPHTPTETQDPTPTPIKSPYPPTSPTPLQPTQQVCHETVGRFEEDQLESDLLEDPLEYFVYLPPCYTEQPDRHYPVLYLFHGQTFSNQHWIDLGVIDLVDRLITSAELAPFIMVFPYDQDHYKPPTDNRFGDAVLMDLIPAIDQQFRTIPNRASRAIGGISRGGNWAAHIGLQHPEIFSAVGLHSTPIFSTDTNSEIKEWLQAIPTDEFPRLFLDIGQSDRWLNFTLIFEELLYSANIPHEWYLYPGFHEDDYWKAHLEQYIRWYALPWSMDRGAD
ncbi:alpha/beta hydrolase [Chloroflexota bacterium]